MTKNDMQILLFTRILIMLSPIKQEYNHTLYNDVCS